MKSLIDIYSNEMRTTKIRMYEEAALNQLSPQSLENSPKLSVGGWIRAIRSALRMTQKDLAVRAKLPQSHVAAIEGGVKNPPLPTLARIMDAMECDLLILPRPRLPIEKILRKRAGKLALKRLKRTMGTMALEGQAPETDLFRQLFAKRTEEIIADQREDLWSDNE